MSQIQHLLQGLGQMPSQFTAALQSGYQSRDQRKSNELAREQLRQKIAFAEEDQEFERYKRAEFQAEEAAQARQMQIQADQHKAQATIDTAVPKAHLELEQLDYKTQQSKVDAEYAEREKQSALRAQQASIQASQTSAQLNQLRAQREAYALQIERDPGNIELRELKRRAEAEEAYFKAQDFRSKAEYLMSDEGQTHSDAKRQAEYYESMAVIQTAIAAAHARTELTQGQAEQIQRELNLPDDVQAMLRTDLGRQQLVARALEENIRQDPSDFTSALELMDTFSNIDRMTTITGTTEHDYAIKESKADELIMEIQNLDRVIENFQIMHDAIQEDPTIAGALGLGRRGLQNVMDVGTTLLDAFGDLTPNARGIMTAAERMAAADLRRGDITQQQYDSWFSPVLADIPRFENSAAYALARARGQTGRISNQLYNEAKSEVAITGFSGPRGVMVRLFNNMEELKDKRASYESRLGRMSGDRTLPGPRADKVRMPTEPAGPSKQRKPPVAEAAGDRHDTFFEFLKKQNPNTAPSALLDYIREEYIEKGLEIPEVPQ